MGNDYSTASCKAMKNGAVHDVTNTCSSNKENVAITDFPTSITGSATGKRKKAKKNPNRPTPPSEEPSLVSFSNCTVDSSSRRKSFSSVIVTDAISDVRQRYHINPKEIGHGHYGVVRKCMDRETKEWYSIKSILKSKISKINVLKREIEILAEVDHKNIIKLIEVHEDMKYLHLITELCTGGELFDRIIAKTETAEGHYSEKDAAKLVASILDAIAYCHERQIVHRDLKPENFLFVSNDEDAPVKIIDFGLSRHEATDHGFMRTKVGTPYYVAPEVLRREYTKSCDIWSLGVITYILLCGYPPFYGESDNQIFAQVKAGRFDFPSPEWDTISDDAKDFVCCLLKLNPSKRLSAAQALNHRWIREQTKGHKNAIRYQENPRSKTFQKFMGMNKLKKVALGYIATHLTEKEVKVLTDMFERLDKNGDGTLTLEQLEKELASCKEFNYDIQEKLCILREDLSLTGSESIVWKDFLAAMADKSLLIKEEKIRIAFDHFRNTGRGKGVRVSDLVDLIGGKEGAKEILDLNQLDDKMIITYDEFRTMMTDSFTDSESGDA